MGSAVHNTYGDRQNGFAVLPAQNMATMVCRKLRDIEVTQEKTGKAVWIPIHRELRPMLAEIPHDAVTVLATASGRPWTKTAFNTAWRRSRPDILRERGLVFHGLRKSAVVTLIEAGCSTAEVAAITGQSLQMVEHYARARDQKRLAIQAMHRWENEG